MKRPEFRQSVASPIGNNTCPSKKKPNPLQKKVTSVFPRVPPLLDSNFFRLSPCNAFCACTTLQASILSWARTENVWRGAASPPPPKFWPSRPPPPPKKICPPPKKNFFFSISINFHNNKNCFWRQIFYISTLPLKLGLSKKKKKKKIEQAPDFSLFSSFFPSSLSLPPFLPFLFSFLLPLRCLLVALISQYGLVQHIHLFRLIDNSSHRPCSIALRTASVGRKTQNHVRKSVRNRILTRICQFVYFFYQIFEIFQKMLYLFLIRPPTNFFFVDFNLLS